MTDTMDNFIVPDLQGEESVESSRDAEAKEAVANPRSEAGSPVDSSSPLLSSLGKMAPAIDEAVRALNELRILSDLAVAAQSGTCCLCHCQQPPPRRRPDESQPFSPIESDDLDVHPVLRSRGGRFRE